MNAVIKELKAYPYSSQDIMNICEGKTKILTYQELQKFKTIDGALKPYDNFVLLYEMKPNFGHWVCVIKHKNPKYKGGAKIEFFDPYGYGIDKQFKFINKNFNGNGNRLKLSELLVNSPYKIVENKKKIQKLKEGVNSCGRHVGFRINMRDMELDDFVKFVSSGSMNADDTITYLTAFN